MFICGQTLVALMHIFDFIWDITRKKEHLMDKLQRSFVFWQTLGCLHQTICTSQYFLMNFTNEKIQSNAQQHTHQNRVFILRVGSVLIDCNLSNIFVIIKNKWIICIWSANCTREYKIHKKHATCILSWQLKNLWTRQGWEILMYIHKQAK